MSAETPAAPVTWPQVIILKHPIEFAGEHVTSITLRRGRIGDAKGLKLKDEIPTNDLLLIASRMSGRPVPMLEALDVEDGGEVIAVAMDFYVSYLGASTKR